MREWYCSCEKCAYNHTDANRCEVCVNFSNFLRLPDKKVELFEELKPCPFCGSDNIRVNMPYAEPCQVQCYNCGCTNGFYLSFEKAVEAWNRRSGQV